MLKLTGQEAYEWGNAYLPPEERTSWQQLITEHPEKEAEWNRIARDVIAIVCDMPDNFAAFFEVLSLLASHRTYVCEECSFHLCLWCMPCQAFTCLHYSLASYDGERCNDCEAMLVEICPFCVLTEGIQMKMWSGSGEPTFGYEAQYAGINCCESCFNQLDAMDEAEALQIVEQAGAVESMDYSIVNY